MKFVALLLVWLLAVGGVGAVACLLGDGPPEGPAPPDDLPPELPEDSPRIRCSLVPKQDEGAVDIVVYSRDGTTLIAGNMNGVLRWYDSASGQMTTSCRVLPKNLGGITALALSPDGRSLASLTNFGQVSLLDAATGVPRLALEKFPSDQTYPDVLQFSPDGKVLAGALTSGEILLWDATTGHRRAVLPAYIVPEHPVGHPRFPKMQKAIAAHVSSLAFTADGRSLVSESQLVRTWDVATGREVGRLEWSARMKDYGSIALSPDDSTLAVGHTFSDDLRAGNAGRITLHDRATGRQLAQLPTQGCPSDLKFLPDGKTLVSLEDDRIIRLWDVATAQQKAAVRLDHHNNLGHLAVSPDGKRIAWGGMGSAHFFGIIYQFETDGSSLKLWKPQP